MTKEAYEIAGRACVTYYREGAQFLVVQPVDENDLEVLDHQVEVMKGEAEAAFILVAFKIRNWNEELSPWDAPPVFGKQGFGHGAEDTLEFVTNALIPEVCRRYQLPETIPVILGGYSLAGLFSLWSAYQTDRFTAIAAASPSVWFPGWREYAEDHTPGAEYIYLSLGDKEEKAKNKVMAAVGDCIRAQYEGLKDGKAVKQCVLEWNEGNHFKDSDIRCAKGFLWCMKEVHKGGALRC